jgi:hypothetical protein
MFRFIRSLATARGHGERTVAAAVRGARRAPGRRGIARKIAAFQRQSIPKQTIQIFRKFLPHSRKNSNRLFNPVC